MVFDPFEDGLVPQRFDVEAIETTTSTCSACTTRTAGSTGCARRTDDVQLIDAKRGVFQFLCGLCRIAEGIACPKSRLAHLIDCLGTIDVIAEVGFLNFDSEESSYPAHSICEKFHKGLQDGHDPHQNRQEQRTECL